MSLKLGTFWAEKNASILNIVNQNNFLAAMIYKSFLVSWFFVTPRNGKLLFFLIQTFDMIFKSFDPYRHISCKICYNTFILNFFLHYKDFSKIQSKYLIFLSHSCWEWCATIFEKSSNTKTFQCKNYLLLNGTGKYSRIQIYYRL